MADMHREVPQLYNLYIYTNEECNLACKHCWVTAKFRKEVLKPAVTIEMYKNFIEQAIPLGLGYVKITGGEALLRKDDVLALVQFTHQHRIPTRIETNGTLIDEEVAKILKETRTMVSVSMDGSTAELHEKMRLVSGCFEDTLRGLALLRKYNIPVEIIFSMYSDNEHDLDNIVQLASTLPKGRVKINPVLASGRGRFMERRGERLEAEDLFAFVKRVEECYRDSAVPVTVSTAPAFHSLNYITNRLVAGGRCGFKSLLGILANGTISYCGMGYRGSDYHFGHVANVDLDWVWHHHPVLNEVRDQIPDKLEGICGNCLMKWTCQGACRSNAFEVYGSITAPSPECQGLYEAGLFPKSRMIDPEVDSSYATSHAT